MRRALVPELVEGAALTDIGLQRESNEDCVGLLRDLGLAMVADGMGGRGIGDEASSLALDTIEGALRSWQGAPVRPGQPWEHHPLATAFKLANVRLHALGMQMHFRGAGAAATAALGVEGGVLIAHVGDSRCYRVRGGQLEQLTRDHALVLDDWALWRYEDAAVVDDLALECGPRSLGVDEVIRVDVRFEPLLGGDLYLLCSDGLSGVVLERRIGELIAGATSLDEACRALVQEANAEGGHDNISVVLARWG